MSKDCFVNTLEGCRDVSVVRTKMEIISLYLNKNLLAIIFSITYILIKCVLPRIPNYFWDTMRAWNIKKSEYFILSLIQNKETCKAAKYLYRTLHGATCCHQCQEK